MNYKEILHHDSVTFSEAIIGEGISLLIYFELMFIEIPELSHSK